MTKTSALALIGLMIALSVLLCFQLISDTSQEYKPTDPEIPSDPINLDEKLTATLIAIDQHRSVLEKYQDENINQLKSIASLLEEIRDSMGSSTNIEGMVQAPDLTKNEDRRESAVPVVNINQLLNSDSELTGWISVFGTELSRAMLERGLTPFSRGVSTYLETASTKLRILKKELKQARNALDEQYPIMNGKRPMFDEYRKLEKALYDDYYSKRNEAIEAFREDLKIIPQHR